MQSNINYTKTELIRAMQAALDDWEKIRAACYPVAAIGKKVNAIKELIEKSDEYSESDLRDLAIIRTTDLYTEYRKSMMKLAYYSSEPFTGDGWLNEREAEARAVTELDQAVEGIYLHVEPRRIYLRTPPLPHRNKPEVLMYTSGGKPFEMTHSNVYKVEVQRAITQSRDMRTILEFRAFQKKTLLYLHVLEGDGTTFAMDNDNRETAQITNVICASLPGGDAPHYCRLIYDATYTDMIPAGAYITVFPTEDILPENEEIIDFWEEKLREKPIPESVLAT